MGNENSQQKDGDKGTKVKVDKAKQKKNKKNKNQPVIQEPEPRREMTQPKEEGKILDAREHLSLLK